MDSTRMTNAAIRQYVNVLRNKRYTTGVLHVAAPEWMQDLRWCIDAILFLLAECEKEQ